MSDIQAAKILTPKRRAWLRAQLATLRGRPDAIRQANALLEKGPDWDPARGSYADFVERWTRHRCQVLSGVRRVGHRGVAHVELREHHAPARGSDPESATVLKRRCARRVAFVKGATVGEVLLRLLRRYTVAKATGARSPAEGSRRLALAVDTARE